jgi:hypothetical protein
MPAHDPLLERQKDLIEVLVGTIGTRIKAGVKERDPEADLALLGEEWGMSRSELVDTLVYIRLHLHNVIVQSEAKRDSPDAVIGPLKLLASWLDEIPDVYDRFQDLLTKSGSDGKGYVKVSMPPIIKECLHIQTVEQPVAQTLLRTPEPL